MTTVVYDHKLKQVAIDSRSTADGMIASDASDKVIRNEFGLWCLCGVTSDYEDFVKLKKHDKPEIIPECSAIVIKDGCAYSAGVCENGLFFIQKLEHSDAHGSGSQFALAALDFGCNAKEAIEYAKKRDIYTGGKVRVYDVKTGLEIE